MHNPINNILLFLFVLFVSSFVALSNQFPFHWYAIFAAIFSLLYPIFGRELSSNIVDFFYYLFAILGVVILFQYQQIDRDIANDSAMMPTYLKRIQHGEQLIAKLDKSTLIEDKEIARKILSAIGSRLGGLDYEIEDCYRERTKLSESGESNHKCETLYSYLNYLEEKPRDNRYIDYLSNSDVKLLRSSLDQAVIHWANRDDDFGRLLNLRLPVADLILLKNEKYSASADPKIRSLIQEVVDINKKNIDRLQEKNQITRSRSLGSQISFFFFGIWPYLLCIALCLKLARKSIFRVFKR